MRLIFYHTKFKSNSLINSRNSSNYSQEIITTLKKIMLNTKVAFILLLQYSLHYTASATVADEHKQLRSFLEVKDEEEESLLVKQPHKRRLITNPTGIHHPEHSGHKQKSQHDTGKHENNKGNFRFASPNATVMNTNQGNVQNKTQKPTYNFDDILAVAAEKKQSSIQKNADQNGTEILTDGMVPEAFSREEGMYFPLHYNPEDRPSKKSGKIDVINVGLDFVQFQGINQAIQQADLDILIKSEWFDPRLEYVEYRGFIHMTEEGWPASRNKAHPSEIHTESLFHEKGHLKLVQRMNVKVIVNFDLWGYPFDEQLVQVKLSSFRYGPDELSLKGYNPPGTRKPRKNTAWSPGKYAVRNTNEPSMFNGGKDDGFVIGAIVVTRQYWGPVSNTLVPLWFILSMALGSLFISHHDHFSAQIATASFAFLTTMTFVGGMNTGTMPPVTSLLWMHWILILCFLTSLTIIFLVTRVHFLLNQHKDEIKQIQNSDDLLASEIEELVKELEHEAAEKEIEVQSYVDYIRAILPASFYIVFILLLVWNLLYSSLRHDILIEQIEKQE